MVFMGVSPGIGHGKAVWKDEVDLNYMRTVAVFISTKYI